MKGMYNTFYDVARSTLWGIKEDGQEYAPRMVFSFQDGNPRLVVYGGAKGVIINFPADYYTMTVIAGYIERIADSEPGSKFQINRERNIWVNGKRTEETEISATLTVGKTKKGIAYIMIEAPSMPQIPFALNKPPFHKLMDGNGQQLDEAEVSREYAKAFARVLKATLPIMMANHTKDSYAHGEYKPKELEPYDNKPAPKKTKPSTETFGSDGVSFDDFDDEIPM